MTRLQATATDSVEGRRLLERLIGIPWVALLAFLCLISLSWAGWGFETDPVDQLLRDAPWVVLAGLTGAGAGGVLTWVVIGGRGSMLAVGATLGALPAVVVVTGYFTAAY